VRLGVLDFSDLGLQETIDLAAQAEALGYARYWLAEHHDSSVHANALMMTLAVAAVTDTIRVGPAGVLLRFQSPLHIANSALLLAALFGGRIDLGLAAGSASQAVAAALLDGRVGTEADDYFDTKVRRLLRLLRHEEQVKPSPQGVDAPPVWILGSSGNRARLAGQEGAGYCLSLFHSPHMPPANVLTQYRESFTPSGALDRPTCSVAVCVVCGDSEAEAQRRRQTCRNPFIHHCLAGTPEQCLEQLLTVCATYRVEDVVVLDGCPTFAERLYSLGLLAEACQLPGVEESHHV
jgi:luciferase family oxidoreductase group 1